jgi:hypothetical protein
MVLRMLVRKAMDKSILSTLEVEHMAMVRPILSMLEGEVKAMSTLSSLEGEGSPMALSILSTEEGLFKAHPTLRAKAAMKGVVVHPVAQLGESVGAREVQVEGVAEAATIKVHLIVLLISTLPVPTVGCASRLRLTADLF